MHLGYFLATDRKPDHRGIATVTAQSIWSNPNYAVGIYIHYELRIDFAMCLYRTLGGIRAWPLLTHRAESVRSNGKQDVHLAPSMRISGFFEK